MGFLQLYYVFFLFRCGKSGAPAHPFYNCIGAEAYMNTNREHLSVLSLNTWGIPGTPDLQERMEAIGGHVAKGKYDLVLLNEVWIKTYHDVIRAALPHGYKMTSYEQLNGSGCLGAYINHYFGLAGCSGLAVISRLPMSNISFTPFSSRGYFSNMFYDGEILAKKGIGSVILTLHNRLTLHVLVTHTAADTWNKDIRENQVDEFLEKVKSSKTTFVIGGGDLNLWPASTAYQKFERVMVNAFQEMYPSSRNVSQFSTYGHSANTFVSEAEDEVLDYIFYGPLYAVVNKTCWMPFLTATRSADQSIMSVSDHEGIACTFVFEEKGTHSGSGCYDWDYSTSGWDDIESGCDYSGSGWDDTNSGWDDIGSGWDDIGSGWDDIGSGWDDTRIG